ncbi:flagellar protein FlaG [Pseudoalteromonas sp. SS15]|uniref:flagellar protein FlaG n=1 Tax=Pseudoalteromonas sp. SS15 TaxID=3139393 RepID=UPI003BAD3FAB
MESQGISQNAQALSSNVTPPQAAESKDIASASNESKAKDSAIELNSAIVSSSDSRESTKGKLSTEELKKVAQQLQEFVSEMNKGLEFSVHEDSGRDVIKVIDKSSGDLVKQYPSEEVLDIVSKLAKATGTLVDYKV